MTLRAWTSRDLLGFVLTSTLVACGVDGSRTSCPDVIDDSPAPMITADAPALLNVLPSEAMIVEPTVVARLVFSRPMDPASNACLGLLAADGTSIPVQHAWDVSGTVVALGPQILLTEGDYVVIAGACAKSIDGVALGSDFASGFRVHVPKDSKGM